MELSDLKISKCKRSIVAFGKIKLVAVQNYSCNGCFFNEPALGKICFDIECPSLSDNDAHIIYKMVEVKK